MVNEQVLSGKWNEISGKIREKWGQLTDDDMQTFHGNATQLVGLIQRKTGEARARSRKVSRIGDSKFRNFPTSRRTSPGLRQHGV